MSSKFIADTLKEINNFRTKPNAIKKPVQMFQTGASRLKTNEKFLKEVKDFADKLDSLAKIEPLVLNETLSKIAEAQVAKYAASPDKYASFLSADKMKGIVPEDYEQEDPCLVADTGADEPSNVPIKLLLNIKDVNHIGRSALTNADYSQIGIGHKQVDEENYYVCIFANNEVDQLEGGEYEVPKGDLTELKMAFDLFDHDKSGKIRIAQAIDAMKRMKFDKSDPTLFTILNELSKNDIVSWPHFAYHVMTRMTDRESTEGLKTIFNLFIDNPEQKTITFETFKRILKEIEVAISDDEMRHILENTTERGNEINFNDFCEYMGEK